MADNNISSAPPSSFVVISVRNAQDGNSNNTGGTITQPPNNHRTPVSRWLRPMETLKPFLCCYKTSVQDTDVTPPAALRDVNSNERPATSTVDILQNRNSIDDRRSQQSAGDVEIEQAEERDVVPTASTSASNTNTNTPAAPTASGISEPQRTVPKAIRGVVASQIKVKEYAGIMEEQIQQLNHELSAGGTAVLSPEIAQRSLKNLHAIVTGWCQASPRARYLFVDRCLDELDALKSRLATFRQALLPDVAEGSGIKQLDDVKTLLGELSEVLFWHRAPKEGDGNRAPFHREKHRGFHCSINAVNAALGGRERLSWAQLDKYVADKGLGSASGVDPADLTKFLRSQGWPNAQCLYIPRDLDLTRPEVKDALAQPRDRCVVLKPNENGDDGHYVALRTDASRGGASCYVDGVDHREDEAHYQTLLNLCMEVRDLPGVMHAVQVILLDSGKDDKLLPLIGQQGVWDMMDDE
jgi:hypothetical protein